MKNEIINRMGIYIKEIKVIDYQRIGIAQLI